MGKFGETDDGKWKNLAFRLKFCYIDYFVVILSVAKYPLAKFCFVVRKNTTQNPYFAIKQNPTNAFDFKKCLFVNTTEFDFA